MVNVQVWWNEIQDGGKIASYSCGEKDVEQVVADFESDYGAVKHICLEDGVVYGIKGNKKYGFKLFADNHFLLISTTEGQMERLMEKIVTDEFEDRIVDGYHCKGSYDRKIEGSENITEKTETETEADDGMVGLSEVCNKVRSLGATETTIAFNPVHNEDGSSDAKIYYYDGSNNEMFNECFDVNVKTIGELEYLKENLPNVVSDSATTFWDNPSLLFCNGFVIQDKEFQMVKGLLLYCKIEGKKLYYRTYESGEWNEIKEKSLEELKLEASKHPLGKWRYTGFGGTLGKVLYALTYYSTDIKMAVMSGYDSIYCEGTSLTGDTFQLRY